MKYELSNVRLCRSPRCGEPVKSFGLCQTHYVRYRWGTEQIEPAEDSQDLHRRLFANIHVAEPDSCWIWSGSAADTGYGSLTVKGVRDYSHRWMWILANKDIPQGLCVLHRCDVRLCVNPKHLFLGTKADNYQDCVAKGRHNKPKGQNCWRSKMTERDVILIRKSPLTNQQLADHYQVASQSINQIRKRITWKHVPSETSPT